jgi:hypothetical protein
LGQCARVGPGDIFRPGSEQATARAQAALTAKHFKGQIVPGHELFVDSTE